LCRWAVKSPTSEREKFVVCTLRPARGLCFHGLFFASFVPPQRAAGNPLPLPSGKGTGGEGRNPQRLSAEKKNSGTFQHRCSRRPTGKATDEPLPGQATHGQYKAASPKSQGEFSNFVRKPLLLGGMLYHGKPAAGTGCTKGHTVETPAAAQKRPKGHPEKQCCIRCIVGFAGVVPRPAGRGAFGRSKRPNRNGRKAGTPRHAEQNPTTTGQAAWQPASPSRREGDGRGRGRSCTRTARAAAREGCTDAAGVLPPAAPAHLSRERRGTDPGTRQPPSRPQATARHFCRAFTGRHHRPPQGPTPTKKLATGTSQAQPPFDKKATAPPPRKRSKIFLWVLARHRRKRRPQKGFFGDDAAP